MRLTDQELEAISTRSKNLEGSTTNQKQEEEHRKPQQQ